MGRRFERADASGWRYDEASKTWFGPHGEEVNAPPPLPKERKSKRKPGGRLAFKQYKPEYAGIARKACEAGMTNFQVAELLKIHESTLNRWRLRHPAFQRAFRLGKEEADHNVERTLYSMAMGHEYEVEKVYMTKYGPERVTEVKKLPPDIAAAMHYLKNRRPDRWRDTVTHQHMATPYDEITSAAELRALLQRQAKALGLLGPMVDVTPKDKELAHDASTIRPDSDAEEVPSK